jgi:hypothetical protein
MLPKSLQPSPRRPTIAIYLKTRDGGGFSVINTSFLFKLALTVRAETLKMLKKHSRDISSPPKYS